MAEQASYKRVPVVTHSDDENDNDNNEIELTILQDDPEDELFEDEPLNSSVATLIQEQEDPPFLLLYSTILTLGSVPILFLWIGFVYEIFTGRLWSVWVFVLHLQLRIGATHSQWTNNATTYTTYTSRLWSLANGVDICFFGILYPAVAIVLIEVLFRDVDGTIQLDWKYQVHLLRIMSVLGGMVAIGRIILLCRCCCCCWWCTKPSLTIPQQQQQRTPISDRQRQHLIPLFLYADTAILGLNILCVFSILSHFGPWPSARILPQSCDPMDTTLCALPFPSFHHMEPDDSTTTGWRVHLKGLVPLRGGIPFHPNFVNELDGFSTMAPILFYMEGLKEAHENAQHQAPGIIGAKLQGPESIALSTTQESITLLIHVESQELVPHSAEIDYLDPQMPLAMILPAQPLHHQAHYAVVVVNATNSQGQRLPRTTGMEQLMITMLQQQDDDDSTRYQERYFNVVFPALRKAAPWVDLEQDPESVQMIFDFVTMSEDSQLGNVRAVRDMVLEQIKPWHSMHNNNHVQVVSRINHDCKADHNNGIGQTLHIQLDVPSFLTSRSRYSILDKEAIRTTPVNIGQAKAMIQIPCSVVNQQQAGGKPIQAIMEYGHGLFYNRDEVTDGFLSRMANDNGYIVMAMDWRGMSLFDLPIVIKTLIGNPNQFQSVRDNLIQGYAEKLALQHFARNGMLDWLKSINRVHYRTKDDKPPASVFYGISQGGILGGGYLALSGKTKLIDRGILGSPGTPFTSVLMRSLDFVQYDTLLLFNFYNNRQVRLLLSLIQMAWDSVEVSGLLSQPLNSHESLPRTLLQTGLGDPIVPTGACEAMTRAMGGSILPNNPRSPIYGIPVVENPINTTNATWDGPDVTLTEILYEQEYKSLPVDNTLPAWGNNVHWCVRWDAALIQQVEEFTNAGRIIDPCTVDQCHRLSTVGC
eukprot:scaffold1525_cov142-Cylindrotheca_fusiformis.AAC.3